MAEEQNCGCDISLRCDLHLLGPAMYEALKEFSVAYERIPDYMLDTKLAPFRQRFKALLDKIHGSGS